MEGLSELKKLCEDMDQIKDARTDPPDKDGMDADEHLLGSRQREPGDDEAEVDKAEIESLLQSSEETVEKSLVQAVSELIHLPQNKEVSDQGKARAQLKSCIPLIMFLLQELRQRHLSGDDVIKVEQITKGLEDLDHLEKEENEWQRMLGMVVAKIIAVFKVFTLRQVDTSSEKLEPSEKEVLLKKVVEEMKADFEHKWAEADKEKMSLSLEVTELKAKIVKLEDNSKEAAVETVKIHEDLDKERIERDVLKEQLLIKEEEREIMEDRVKIGQNNLEDLNKELMSMMKQTCAAQEKLIDYQSQVEALRITNEQLVEKMAKKRASSPCNQEEVSPPAKLLKEDTKTATSPERTEGWPILPRVQQEEKLEKQRENNAPEQWADDPERRKWTAATPAPGWADKPEAVMQAPPGAEVEDKESVKVITDGGREATFKTFEVRNDFFQSDLKVKALVMMKKVKNRKEAILQDLLMAFQPELLDWRILEPGKTISGAYADVQHYEQEVRKFDEVIRMLSIKRTAEELKKYLTAVTQQGYKEMPQKLRTGKVLYFTLCPLQLNSDTSKAAFDSAEGRWRRKHFMYTLSVLFPAMHRQIVRLFCESHGCENDAYMALGVKGKVCFAFAQFEVISFLLAFATSMEEEIHEYGRACQGTELSYQTNDKGVYAIEELKKMRIHNGLPQRLIDFWEEIQHDPFVLSAHHEQFDREKRVARTRMRRGSASSEEHQHQSRTAQFDARAMFDDQQGRDRERAYAQQQQSQESWFHAQQYQQYQQQQQQQQQQQGYRQQQQNQGQVRGRRY